MYVRVYVYVCVNVSVREIFSVLIGLAYFIFSRAIYFYAEMYSFMSGPKAVFY